MTHSTHLYWYTEFLFYIIPQWLTDVNWSKIDHTSGMQSVTGLSMCPQYLINSGASQNIAQSYNACLICCQTVQFFQWTICDFPTIMQELYAHQYIYICTSCVHSFVFSSYVGFCFAIRKKSTGIWVLVNSVACFVLECLLISSVACILGSSSQDSHVGEDGTCNDSIVHFAEVTTSATPTAISSLKKPQISELFLEYWHWGASLPLRVDNMAVS